MDVRLPDGTIIKNVPDGTTKADLAAKLKANGMTVPSEWLDAPKPEVAQEAGGALRQIPRQLGLTARYGMEGLAQVGDIVHEPIRGLVNLAGGKADKSLTQMASGVADAIGLPSPEGANERVIGDASRLVAGAGGLAGVAGAGARATQGTAQKVFQTLATNPGSQSVSAATGGLAGGAVREAGGGPVEQFAASLAGGLAGGFGLNGIQAGAAKAKQMLTPAATELQRADQQISLTLQRQGIDWSQVPERVRQSMRAEAASAMSNGQPLNADALRRLLTMQRAGVTPTVGQLTQNPGQITREMNLAKSGANSTDPSLQRLAGLQNENTSNLLRRLDESGAAAAQSAPDTARNAIGSLNALTNRTQGQVNALYSQARDSSGRSLPLEGGTFTRRASELIDEAMAGDKLPKAVENRLNAIARGEYPLTVASAEAFKTRIGDLMRASTDGTERKALRLVRQALDETPLQPSPQVNPGNLPAVPGTVPASAQVVGQEAIDAFNRARSAHRAFMQRQEANPALRAVVEGVEPDQFVNRFVLSKQATAANVRTLRNDLDPEAVQGLKNYVVRHLRDAATNSTDDITKFSNTAYRKALRDIGEDKLSVFFNAEERQLLSDIGDAAKYMQAQPAGSAVNNSNSGALVIGRGLDMLQSVSQKLPLGLRDVISGTIQGQQQRQVLTPANALRQLAPPEPPANLLSLPLLTGAASAQSRDDNSRNQRP